VTLGEQRSDCLAFFAESGPYSRLFIRGDTSRHRFTKPEQTPTFRHASQHLKFLKP
jgi:hypothetical protein